MGECIVYRMHHSEVDNFEFWKSYGRQPKGVWRTKKYQPGDFILWNPQEHPKSFRSTKLAPKLLGPYVVIHQKTNDITCQHLQSHTEHVFHSSRVSPYIGSEVSAKNISLLDAEEYVVESITNHRGTWKHLSMMEFLVNWRGYAPEDSTWERWIV